MPLKKTDWVIVIIFGLIVGAIILSMLVEPVKTLLSDYIEPPKGEKARFIRYMGCAIVACTKGCRSDETYDHALEYEKNKVIKSCNQLLEEEFGCGDESPEGATYCGSDFSIPFTFNEKVEYRGDYYVVPSDPSTLSDTTCTMFDSGWQTDASCIGRWDDIMSCEIKHCTNRNRPYGRLIEKPDGCGTGDPSLPPPASCGSIGISNVLASNCESGDVGEEGWKFDNSLVSCEFGEGDTIYIWAESFHAYIIPSCDPWFRSCIVPIYSGPHDCPKVAICDHS